MPTARLGAQHCRLTAQIRCPRLLQALRECCVRNRVEILENISVCGLIKEGGYVRGVQTAKDQILGGTTVLCAGAWSSSIDPVLREQAPVYPIRGQIILFHMKNKPFSRNIEVIEDKFYLVRRQDGYILAGSTQEHDSGFNKRNTAWGLAKLTSQCLRHMPVLAEATLIRSWAGLRPGTPDRRPFMGFVSGVKNLIVATGHFRTGLVFAPVTADIVADLLHNGTCNYDLKKCSPGRDYPQQADFSHLPEV